MVSQRKLSNLVFFKGKEIVRIVFCEEDSGDLGKETIAHSRNMLISLVTFTPWGRGFQTEQRNFRKGRVRYVSQLLSRKQIS